MPKGDHNKVLSDQDIAEIVYRYTHKRPDGTWDGAKIIARHYGVTDTTIRHHLIRMGVVMRDSKESHAHGKRCGPIKHTEQLGEAPECACGCGMQTYWVRGKYRWAKYVQGHYRKDAPYKNADWLRRQYIELNRSVNDIASENGVYATTVMKQMRKFNIDRRDASASKMGRFGGSKNPAWKGGVTPERQQLYKQQEWKAFVRSIYERDNFTCQRCGAPKRGNRGLHAHHIKSWADHPDLRFDADNLITLCRKCHSWVHSKQNTASEYLQ